MTSNPVIQLPLDASDRVRILELLGRYGMLIDDKRWASLEQIFTPEATFDVSDIGLELVVGLAAIVDMMETVVHPLGHVITNAHIESVEDDHVRTRCRLLAISTDFSVHLGQYSDKVVRTDDGWRIAERKFTSHPPGSIEVAYAADGANSPGEKPAEGC